MQIIIKIGTMILNLIYSMLKLLPMKKKVLFLSRQSNTPSLDFTMLQDKIRELHPDFEIVTLCRFIKPGLADKILYCFHMLRQMYHLATAEIVVLDSYAILVSLLNHRKKLLVVQMWHSVGTMKQFGYSILDKAEGTSSKTAYAMKMHRNYDHILCAGEGYRSHLASGFNCPEDKIVILPLPRVERLKDQQYWEEKKQTIYSKYPALADKKNILYVPTFRKTEDEQQEFSLAVNALKKALQPYSSQFNLIVKAHPLSKVAFEYPEFSSFDMLAVANHIISDYSCIIYEGAVMHIPLHFYTYDYESYTASRDIYMDYPNEIPNKMYHDPADLMAAIHSGNYDMGRQETFLRKYVSYESRHITQDIVDFIWNNRKGS